MQQLRNFLEFAVDSLRISPFISDVGLALNLQINQVLLDEVKWGQQWGLDIEYIKVLSVKAMKATFGTEFGTFLEIIIVFSSWCYEY